MLSYLHVFCSLWVCVLLDVCVSISCILSRHSELMQFIIGTTISKYHHLALLSCEFFAKVCSPSPWIIYPSLSWIGTSPQRSKFLKMSKSSLKFSSIAWRFRDVNQTQWKLRGYKSMKTAEQFGWYGKPRKHFTASWSLKHGSKKKLLQKHQKS